MSGFKWRPLASPTEIRLLVLLRGSGPDEVQFRLNHIELSQAAQYSYEALSYEWGPQPDDPENEPLIYIDGLLKRVRRNLLDAIVHIRQPDRDRHIWVDAICMNQEDSNPVAKAEKRHSIMMMGSIFRSAMAVIVWLGPAAHDSDTAIATIEWIYQNCPLETSHSLGYVDDGGPQLISDAAFAAIDTLCQRNYWKRVWMIQELHLAAELDIYCGSSHTSGSAFESTLSYFYHDGRIRYQGLESITHSIPFDFHFNYRQPGYKDDPRKTTFSFWITEAITKGFQCYKVQDVAYALIGQSYGLVPGDVVPDYDKPVELVVVDALVLWADGNLEPEYGSQKFVTVLEATMLANRLLPSTTAADGTVYMWAECNSERFDELYNSARNEWWRKSDLRRAGLK